MDQCDCVHKIRVSTSCLYPHVAQHWKEETDKEMDITNNKPNFQICNIPVEQWQETDK